MGRPKTLKQSLPGLGRMCVSFWPYLRRQRLLIAGSLLALLLGVGLRLLEPWPLKLVFDRILPLQRHEGGENQTLLDGLDSTTLVLIAALAVVAIAGLRAFASYCYTVGFALLSVRVVGEVRNHVYCHLQRLSLSFHARSRSGDLIIRIISDVALLQDVTVSAAVPLLANGLILLGMMAVMFLVQWQLALLVLLVLPLIWLSTVRVGRRLREVSREQRQREGATAATAAESLRAIQIVQALSLEEMFAKTFDIENQKGLGEGVKASRLSARLERTVDVLIAVGTALVLWQGTRLVLSQQITPGDLIVFLAYLKTALRPVRDLAKYSGRLAKASASGERVLDVLERTPDIRDLPDAVPAPPFQGWVCFEGVNFAYEPGKSVLEQITFEAQPGQQVALVGPSGIGKSTLISLILRLYDPVQGRVVVDGRDIREYTLMSLRAQIGVVLQDTVLFAASVWDNIAYGAPSATHEAIETAARLANAHEFIQALPQGYDTILGERGVTLSHGQRQRVAIARAAIRRAPLLILDEPTTGLDEENHRAVVDALRRLAVGHTCFLVTHDLQFAARADLILYLEGGRVLERGTHAELMDINGRYATLHRLQLATGNLADNGHESPAAVRRENLVSSTPE